MRGGWGGRGWGAVLFALSSFPPAPPLPSPRAPPLPIPSTCPTSRLLAPSPRAPPPPRRFWQGKHIYLIRCVLVFNVHVNVTSSQLCWCSKDQINILPWAQCAFPEEMAGRGLDWGLRTSHPLSVMVSFPPAPLAGSPPWGRAVRSFSLARSLARSFVHSLVR